LKVSPYWNDSGLSQESVSMFAYKVVSHLMIRDKIDPITASFS